MRLVFQRRTTGSVVCPSCGSLVGVRDDKCYSCGRSNPGLWGFGPMLRSIGADFGFAPIVIGTCATLWVIMLLMSGSGIQMGGILSAFTPSPAILFLFGESGAVPVFGAGRWWTVLSAGWLHAGLLHILMNMYWVRMMGPAITELFGPARTVIIYTVGGVAGFALSSFAGAFLPALPFLRTAGFTVGASAPVFGLIGDGARARRSHDHRDGLPRCDSPVNRRLGHHRIQVPRVSPVRLLQTADCRLIAHFRFSRAVNLQSIRNLHSEICNLSFSSAPALRR